MRLVDGVSGPARGIVQALGLVNGAATRFAGGAMAPTRAINSMARGVRSATNNLAGLGTGLSIGIAAAAKSAYSMEKALNVSVAAGELNAKQRVEFMETAIALNSEYAATAGEIVDAGNELLKAGFTYDQMKGSLRGILDTAQAMGVPIVEASSAVVNSMTSMRMAMGTSDEAMGSSLKMADLYAQAVRQTTADLADFATSSKYFNPAAAAMGMSPEEAIAWQMSLAKSGIKGSSAGTGLRSAPVSIAAPTKAARGALAGLKIDHTKFVGKRRGDANGATIASVLESAGFSAEGLDAQIDQIIKDPKFQKAPAKMANAIMDSLGDQIGLVTGEDRAQLSTNLQNAINAGVSEVDMIGFLKALRAAGAGLDDYAAIFGRNHFTKMMAIQPEIFDQMLNFARNSDGVAKQMRTAMMAGIVGDVAELTAAFELLAVSIGKAGLLSDAAKAITSLAGAMQSLGQSNPGLLRFAAYAVLAVAALAPLGFALSGLASVVALAVNPLALIVAGLGTLAFINLEPISNGIKAFNFGFMNMVDPAIVARINSAKESMGSLLDVFTMRDLALVGPGMGFGEMFAQGVNKAYATLPQIREMASSIAEFGKGAFTDAMPKIQSGMDSLVSFAERMAGSKFDAITNLTNAWVDFGNRAAPFFTPTLSTALDLIGTSFNTMAAGAEAVGTVLGAATDGMVAFATALIEKISPEALQGAGDGISTVLKTIGAEITNLGNFFRNITEAIGGAHTSITNFAAMAGGALGEGLNKVAGIIGPVVDTIVSILGKIVTVVESVISAFGRISSAKITMPTLLGGGATPTPIGAPSIVGARNAGASIGAMAGPAPAPASLPGKAAGGAVRRGMTYEINERGRETVTMGTNGYVTPAHRTDQGGGAGPINIHIHGASNPEATARAVERRLGARLGRSRQVALDGR